MKNELSKDDAVKFLESCEWRPRDGGVEVNYDGNWLGLCRTDYMDDVATTQSTDGDTPKEIFQHYQKKLRRLTPWEENVAVRVMIDEPTFGYIYSPPDYNRDEGKLVENRAYRFSIIDSFSDG